MNLPFCMTTTARVPSVALSAAGSLIAEGWAKAAAIAAEGAGNRGAHKGIGQIADLAAVCRSPARPAPGCSRSRGEPGPLPGQRAQNAPGQSSPLLDSRRWGDQGLGGWVDRRVGAPNDPEGTAQRCGRHTRCRSGAADVRQQPATKAVRTSPSRAARILRTRCRDPLPAWADG